jgi:nucleotide-binding universal stress UspA family protein
MNTKSPEATVTEPAPSGATTPIVVAINAVRRCGETLELATALASSLGADLDVVFVEDENLLRLSDLPVAREVDRFSGAIRELDSQRMLRALRCELRQLRRELSRLGMMTSVRSTVRVVRGHYLTEALAASASVNVTFVHGARRPFPEHHLPGAPLRLSASGAKHGPAGRTGRRTALWTLFDGSQASARALKVAVKLAHTLAGKLVVLVPGSAAGDIESRKREAQIAADRADLQYLVVAGDRLPQLGGVLAPGAGSLLVLARESPGLEDNAARSYLESLAMPVVLVA